MNNQYNTVLLSTVATSVLFWLPLHTRMSVKLVQLAALGVSCYVMQKSFGDLIDEKLSV